MGAIDIIDGHLIIRETVGYEVLNQVPIEDMPKVMEFLKIVYNYNRMKRVAEKSSNKRTVRWGGVNPETGWSMDVTEVRPLKS